jgi:hypothetical protein
MTGRRNLACPVMSSGIVICQCAVARLVVAP